MLIIYDDHIEASYIIIIYDHHDRDLQPGRDRGIGPSRSLDVGLGLDPDRDMGHQADGAFTMLSQCTYFRTAKMDRLEYRSREG